MIWGLFLPMTVGADAIRTFLTSRTGMDIHVVVASIVVERMLGFIASLFFGLMSLLFLRVCGFVDSRFDSVLVADILCLLMALSVFAISLSSSGLRVLMSWLPKRLTKSHFGMALDKFSQTYSQYRGKRGQLSAFFS